MGEPYRCVVIGGGVAGLLAARSLARSGVAVTVLEAAGTVGGRVSSIELDGLALDAGAESFATRGGVVADLARELGLGDRVVSPLTSPAWVVTPERSYPLPATGWLGIPVQPFARAVRKVLGWRGAWRAWSDRWRPLGDLADDVTVGALVRERMGDAVAERLVAPVIAGVYSRPIDELPLAAISPGLPDQVREAGGLIAAAKGRRAASPAGAAVQSLVGGMAQLTRALERDVRDAGVEIVVGASVTGLTQTSSGWSVTTSDHDYEAARLVLAVPLPVARQWFPALADHTHGYVALVTLVVDAPALDAAPRGTGVLAVGGVTRAKALTHMTAKWPWLAQAATGRHVVRLSYSVGDAHEDVASHALADASALLGVELDPSQVRAMAQVGWPDASPVKVDASVLPDGVTVVGSAAGLSGLAAIVAAARDNATT